MDESISAYISGKDFFRIQDSPRITANMKFLIIEQILKNLMIKFFFQFKKPLFGLFSQFWGQKLGCHVQLHKGFQHCAKMFSRYYVCCEQSKSGRTSLNFSERAFDIMFRSTFNKKILPLFFFSINLMIGCLQDLLKCCFSLTSCTESTQISISSSKNVSKCF